MLQNLEKYLLEAAGSDKEEIALENPFRNIGFDGEQTRLGWAKTFTFLKIKESLENISVLLEGKKSFIFIGMGGSINGMKPLFTAFKSHSFYTLDNLDPAALEDILGKIDDLSQTLVIAISKSGTTKETQLLASSLKELFSILLDKDEWHKNFLWLSDPCAFKKLDSLGWERVKKASIQFDGQSDIGGRFSSPHTLIFFLPLFLLLNKNLNKLEEIYNLFVSLQEKIREKAYQACAKYSEKKDAYFSPVIARELGESFSSWIVQLFQESLGSKDKKLPVKTITNATDKDMFSELELDLKIDNPAVKLMSQMYFFQVFVAYYSAFKNLNFVTQDFVEKYKQQMNELENRRGKEEILSEMNLEEIIAETKKNILLEQNFIEIVLYFYPAPVIMEAIRESFAKAFRGKKILIFIGSDWNHQSYQAAFAAKDTYFVLLITSYRLQAAGIPTKILSKNAETFKMIAKATYLTLKSKAIFVKIKAPIRRLL